MLDSTGGDHTTCQTTGINTDKFKVLRGDQREKTPSHSSDNYMDNNLAICSFFSFLLSSKKKHKIMLTEKLNVTTTFTHQIVSCKVEPTRNLKIKIVRAIYF